MAAKKQVRMEWLQVLRGVAATMVFFDHVCLSEMKEFGKIISLPHFLMSGDAGVDVFFVISGFIMLFITPQRIDSVRGWLEFIYRRLTRIFPPYWIVFVVMFAVWLRKPELFNNYYHNQMDVWRSFFLVPQSFETLVGVGWTLIHELYFYFVFSALLIWGITGRISLLIIWFGTVLLVNLLGWTEKLEGQHVLQLISSPFSLEFQLGVLIALCYKKFNALRFAPWLCALLAIGGIVAIYGIGHFIPYVGVYPNNNHLFRVGYYGLAAFFTVFWVVQLDTAARTIKAPHWAVLCGDASYSFYLLHGPIVVALYKIFRSITPYPNFGIAICYDLLVIVAAFSVAILFHVKIERRLISFFHRLAVRLFKKPVNVTTGEVAA
ncbi:MAG TPA: acyltransferase [Verrucomicrobiae bacterium]|jgi:peptidoglycan/LPS O-acetylase OafA/YrhL